MKNNSDQTEHQIIENRMLAVTRIPKEVRDKIDSQLLKIAQINCQMGVDTKADERIEYRRQIKVCLNEIKELDKPFYDEIVPFKDDKI